eukprot:SAG31_NODE_12876_length_909_cov_2.891358_1_plen_128_part_01
MLARTARATGTVTAITRPLLRRRAAAAAAAGLHSTAWVQKLVNFKLPDIGEGIAEVEILQWHFQPGDSVEAFDNVVEVQSDKATVDISSPHDGKIVALHFEPGDMAPTGSILYDIDVEDEDEDEDGGG